MDDSEKKRPRGEHAIMQPEISDEVADGVYANIAAVTFSPAEFVIDFGRAVPGRPNFKVMSRIIASPLNAKQLMLNLTEQIKRFEQQFGEIKIPPRIPSAPPGFKQ